MNKAGELHIINPLSIQNGQTISGKEINEWCKDQILNNKSHARDARRLLEKHYQDDRFYMATFKIETGCGDKPHVRIFNRLQ